MSGHVEAEVPPVGSQWRIERSGFGGLLDVLHDRGYRVVGETVRDGAIVLDEIGTITDLPEGWAEDQEGGSYRLRRRDDVAFFGHAVGPQSWRRFLSPPRSLLWKATRTDDGFSVEEPALDPPRYAFIGVRGCDLRAIAVQDQVFATSTYPDPDYTARRNAVFIVAVNCTEPGGTCFCTSMGTGPRAGAGFDLALTEVLDGGQHFVVEVGSPAGADVLSAVEGRAARTEEVQEAATLVDDAAGRMGRSMVADGLRDLLAATLEHPRWDDVASRCLSCANCTLVCPTCFCSTVEDVADVTGDHAERWQRWDSCFTADFSYANGGSVRTSTRSRYRQWLTHKLGTWHDQFGSSGCVGCGRCITWCPVGIDLTEEVAALRSPGGSEEPK